MERQAGFDFLTIYAHPFRPRREVTNLPPSLYDRLDALDLNAKDLCNFGTEMRQRLETFGSQCGLPIVAGSDTHHPHQLGVVYNLFEQPFETVADLKALIQRGAYMLHIDKELPLKVRAAEEAKAILKRQKLIA